MVKLATTCKARIMEGSVGELQRKDQLLDTARVWIELCIMENDEGTEDCQDSAVIFNAPPAHTSMTIW